MGNLNLSKRKLSYPAIFWKIGAVAVAVSFLKIKSFKFSGKSEHSLTWRYLVSCNVHLPQGEVSDPSRGDAGEPLSLHYGRLSVGKEATLGQSGHGGAKDAHDLLKKHAQIWGVFPIG